MSRALWYGSELALIHHLGFGDFARGPSEATGWERRIILWRRGRRTEEVHRLRLLEPAWVRRQLERAGFSVKRRAGYASAALGPGLACFEAVKPWNRSYMHPIGPHALEQHCAAVMHGVPGPPQQRPVGAQAKGAQQG